MIRFSLFISIVFLFASTQIHGQTKNDPLLKDILSNIQDSTTKSVLNNPDQYRIQIIYTQINRDKKGKPTFSNYQLNVDPEFYFNPASMVKMPLAFLAMEKLNQLILMELKKDWNQMEIN